MIISRILEGTAGIDISITNTLLYQVVSLIFILLNIIYFVFVNVSYGREWLNTDRTEKKILKDMRIISDSAKKKHKNIFNYYVWNNVSSSVCFSVC